MDTLADVQRSVKVCSVFIALLMLLCAGIPDVAQGVAPGPVHAGDIATTRQQAEPARVLVLGDSVFHAFTHVDSAAEIMNKSQPTLFATQGCQRLVVEGCMAFAKLSALQQLRRYAGQFTDVVVVGTGYNDRLGPEFKAAVLAITDEAKEQGVDVLWVTYREVRHVRGKAKVMNEQLARLDQRIEHLHIADWNAFSSDSNDWFRSDRLHLVTLGAEKLAELLNTEIATILAARDAARGVPAP